MATKIGMPSLGHTMEKGTLLRWFKQEGEYVEKGVPLFEVETDKVTVEVESPASGVLLKILVGENEERPIGYTLAFLGEQGETLSEQELQTVEAENQKLLQKKTAEFSFPMPPAPSPAPPRPAQSPSSVDTSRIRISPVARKLAEEHGIDIARLTGTGPGGRIGKEDVERAIEEKSRVGFTTIPLTVLQTIPLTGIRKRVAERMRSSWESVPQVTEVMEVDVTALVQYRERMLPQWEQQYGVRVSLNDLLLKGVALTLKQIPRLNAALHGNEIQLYKEVHIGNAVNLEEGLIVPVLRNVDQKSIGEIAQESKALAEKARAGKLTIEEISGGTFTVTNLGGAGIDLFTPIINPPQCAILGVGRVAKRPVVVEDDIKIRSMVYLCLVFDHRVVDGLPAAQFLSTLGQMLGTPEKL